MASRFPVTSPLRVAVIVAAASLLGCGGGSGRAPLRGVTVPNPLCSGTSASAGAGGTSALAYAGAAHAVAATGGAIALAAAGATVASPTCAGGLAPAPSTAPVAPGAGVSIPTVTPRAAPPVLEPRQEDPGRFDCRTADGDTDVVVADSHERAIEVCRALTARPCTCAEP